MVGCGSGVSVSALLHESIQLCPVDGALRKVIAAQGVTSHVTGFQATPLGRFPDHVQQGLPRDRLRLAVGG
ncbi:hypothetical protein GGQ08_003298 [Salinibacter ruber]|nr:hypothetical protein [Salinibacter ruber]